MEQQQCGVPGPDDGRQKSIIRRLDYVENMAMMKLGRL
jgi:hypothetical protein